MRKREKYVRVARPSEPEREALACDWFVDLVSGTGRVIDRMFLSSDGLGPTLVRLDPRLPVEFCREGTSA